MRDTEEGVAKATADHETRMRQLQDRVDASEKQLSEVLKRDRDEEQQLRKDKTRAEKDLNAKIAQYDDAMETRRKSHEEIVRLFASECSEYAALKTHFDRVDSDNALAAEEELVLGAVRRREEYMRALMHKAATRIQSLFQRRSGEGVRRLRDKLSKKKKGGKKAKGK